MTRKFYLSLGGAAAILVILGAGPMTIRTDGLEFPDGTVQTSAAAADPRRAFYLTATGAQGNQALGACVPGFHMASFWEIAEVSTLRYATEVTDAVFQLDAGEGPPSALAGWIRTGYSFSDAGTVSGQANCNLWTDNSGSSKGSVVSLTPQWASAPTGRLGYWFPAAVDCNVSVGVWCVAD